MNKFFPRALATVLPLVLAAALGAQTQNEPGITKQQADQILDELRQIRQLLEKQNQGAPGQPAKPGRATLDMRGTPMLGSKDAPLTIVEFTDYQCPFCQRFHALTFGDLKKNYIDTGKVRFYSRDLPLDSLHPNAIRAAEAARCANEQGQFWKLREVMSNNPDKLDIDNLMTDAQQLKLDTTVFRSCVEGEKYKGEIQSDVLEAMKIGADGTPAFVIGKSTADGVDGELLVGAQPFGVFDARLKLLEKN